MARVNKPKANYAKLVGNLKKKADEMAKQKQAGKPSTTGSATVTSNDNKPVLADTNPVKPTNKNPVVIKDNTMKKTTGGSVVWRVSSENKEAIKKKVVKDAVKRGAKKVTITSKKPVKK